MLKRDDLLRRSVGTVDSKCKFAICLIVFSVIVCVTSLLPSGYSSEPYQVCTATTTEGPTVTGTAQIVSTSTTSGSQASTQTITVGTSTSVTVVTIRTCDETNIVETWSVTATLDPLVVILVTVPVTIAEYPLGVALLAILTIVAYGLIKRKTTLT